MDVAHLRGPLLRAVSRSFYLSIRLLPAKLRDPIALAYLLARATDTIADTAEIDPQLRTRELARLAARIQNDDEKGEDSLRSFAALQEDEGEQQLIEALPECFAWLDRLPTADRAEIRKVLARINEGQTLDLQRFRDPTRVVALETASDLDRYTYLVAGAVGEFWTNTCFGHLPNFAGIDQSQMQSLGVEYGKGLQLINILRDVGGDLQAGRCYLPAEELHSLGLSPDDLKTEPERAEAVLQKWLQRAEAGLEAGMEYAGAIRPWRVRLATALPALIGARTLALMKRAGSGVFVRKVKMPRNEVRKIIVNATVTLASPRALRAAFSKALSS